MIIVAIENAIGWQDGEEELGTSARGRNGQGDGHD